jgi:hypothetical protein
MSDAPPPQRIQRKRTKGWRMPEGAVFVGRPTKWGNPFRVGHHYKRDADGGIPRMSIRFVYLEAFEGHQDASFTTIASAQEAVDWFRWYMGTHLFQREAERQLIREKLTGHDLACWCPLDQPCHADVLLEIANV